MEELEQQLKDELRVKPEDHRFKGYSSKFEKDVMLYLRNLAQWKHHASQRLDDILVRLNEQDVMLIQLGEKVEKLDLVSRDKFVPLVYSSVTNLLFISSSKCCSLTDNHKMFSPLFSSGVSVDHQQFLHHHLRNGPVPETAQIHNLFIFFLLPCISLFTLFLQLGFSFFEICERIFVRNVCLPFLVPQLTHSL